MACDAISAPLSLTIILMIDRHGLLEHRACEAANYKRRTISGAQVTSRFATDASAFSCAFLRGPHVLRSAVLLWMDYSCSGHIPQQGRCIPPYWDTCWPPAPRHSLAQSQNEGRRGGSEPLSEVSQIKPRRRCSLRQGQAHLQLISLILCHMSKDFCRPCDRVIRLVPVRLDH